MRRVAIVLVALCAILPGELAGQNSIYGIRGLGFPGRWTTARGRALGGGPGAFDPVSPINPAGVAAFPRVTVLAGASTDLRGYTVGDVSVDGLRATRFPLVLIGGRAGNLPVGFAVSYAQYIERSYDVTLTDTIDLRGVPIAVTDRTISQGGISDLRGAVGVLLSPRLRLGAAVHMLSGSAKLTLRRDFADSTYRPYRLTNEDRIKGLGFSAGVVWAPLPGVQVGLAARTDTRADIEVDSTPQGSVNLPTTLVAGLELAPHRALRWSATGIWRSWSDADPDVAARAFDTWEIGTGLELGGAETGASRVPLRLGFRYATLPFTPSDDQPHEITLALGTGVTFAGNRALLDVALERAMRDGGGASERAWQLSWTMTVRP